MDYVDLGLAALTASEPHATGALVPQDGPRLLTVVGIGVVGALAILGIGAALSPVAEQLRLETLTKLGYNPYAIEPLHRTLDLVKQEAEGGRWGLSIPAIHENLDEQLIREALRATKGNRTHAARLLSRSRRWLLYRIADYKIKPEAPPPQLELVFEAAQRRATQAASAMEPPPVICRPLPAAAPDTTAGGEELPPSPRSQQLPFPEVIRLRRRTGAAAEAGEAHGAVRKKKKVTAESVSAALASIPTYSEDEDIGPLPIKRGR